MYAEGTTPTSRVRLILTLDGGNQQLAWARPDASFRFHEVPPGSHLLDVVAMGLVFPQVRLHHTLLEVQRMDLCDR